MNNQECLDMFAAMAMQSLMLDHDHTHGAEPEDIASLAYEQAQAMMVERARRLLPAPSLAPVKPSLESTLPLPEAPRTVNALISNSGRCLGLYASRIIAEGKRDKFNTDPFLSASQADPDAPYTVESWAVL